MIPPTPGSALFPYTTLFRSPRGLLRLGLATQSKEVRLSSPRYRVLGHSAGVLERARTSRRKIGEPLRPRRICVGQVDAPSSGAPDRSGQSAAGIRAGTRAVVVAAYAGSPQLRATRGGSMATRRGGSFWPTSWNSRTS